MIGSFVFEISLYHENWSFNRLHWVSLVL